MNSTKTIAFYGQSDDLIEVDVDGKSWDEFGVYGSKTDSTTFQITYLDHRLNVLALYGASGATWCFAPALVEDGDELPTWPIRILQQRFGKEAHYSTRLEVDVPKDAKLFFNGQEVT